MNEFSSGVRRANRSFVRKLIVISFLRFSKNDLIGTVIMPLKDADLYGMLMRREVDQRKGLLKVRL